MMNPHLTKQNKQQLLFRPYISTTAVSDRHVGQDKRGDEEGSFEKCCPDCDALLEIYFDDVGNTKYQCDNCSPGIFFYNIVNEDNEQDE